MTKFDIPIALYIFKRSEKAILIIRQLSKIRPKRIYLIGDGPRDASEKEIVEKCRRSIETAITWECEIIRNYATINRGVYENIAGGAKWVFERESEAIFLEDDNLPEVSFFDFCKELLARYRNDERVLWICGTNYLEKYDTEDSADYVFTQLMLPCGWASWSHKFLKYYDGNLDLYSDSKVLNKVKAGYRNKKLLAQNLLSWEMERQRINDGLKPISWDFQMAFSIRANNLFGIAPRLNQIQNIGIDEHATHGTGSRTNLMVKRFCEIPTHSFTFPLKHPKSLLIDFEFEERTSKIIILPLKVRIKSKIGRMLKKILHIPVYQKIRKRK